jgi:hypothetical protein
MPGLVPASTPFRAETQTWMAGTSPAMTTECFTAVPGDVEPWSLPGLTRQSIHLRKKMDARVPQTSLRSLRKLDCVPAHDAGEQRFNSSGIHCSVNLNALSSLFAQAQDHSFISAQNKGALDHAGLAIQVRRDEQVRCGIERKLARVMTEVQRDQQLGIAI